MRDIAQRPKEQEGIALFGPDEQEKRGTIFPLANIPLAGR